MGRKKTYLMVDAAVIYAAEYGIDVSRVSIIKWTKKFKLGHQLGGRGGMWVLEREKFRRFIHGKCGYETIDEEKQTETKEEQRTTIPSEITQHNAESGV